MKTYITIAYMYVGVNWVVSLLFPVYIEHSGFLLGWNGSFDLLLRGLYGQQREKILF